MNFVKSKCMTFGFFWIHKQAGCITANGIELMQCERAHICSLAFQALPAYSVGKFIEFTWSLYYLYYSSGPSKRVKLSTYNESIYQWRMIRHQCCFSQQFQVIVRLWFQTHWNNNTVCVCVCWLWICLWFHYVPPSSSICLSYSINFPTLQCTQL